MEKTVRCKIVGRKIEGGICANFYMNERWAGQLILDDREYKDLTYSLGVGLTKMPSNRMCLELDDEEVFQ